jgi:hypothetical protein
MADVYASVAEYCEATGKVLPEAPEDSASSGASEFGLITLALEASTAVIRNLTGRDFLDAEVYPEGVPAAVVYSTIIRAAILRLEDPRATQRMAEGFAGSIGTTQRADQIVDTLLAPYIDEAYFV